MTISSETRRAGPFTGNGATTVFPFAFKVFEKADLQVVRLDALAVEHVLVLDSDYSVALNADQDTDPGGTITYPISGSPLPSTETLTVVGALGYLQPTDITNQGGFYPDVVEKSLDRAVILVQQLYELSLRSVRVPVSDSGGGSNELPATDARKGTVLAFNETTGAPEPGPSIASVGTVAGNVAAINSVAGSIADINTVADNLAALVGASSFAAVYQGAYAADPTTRNDASPLQPGDLYFNTANAVMRVYSGSAWLDSAVTPELQANLLLRDGSVAMTATGSLRIAKGTTAQRPAAGADQEAGIRLNKDTGKFEGTADGTNWSGLGGGATGGGADEIFVENGQTVTQDYTLPAGKNATTAGRVVIADGVTVTLSNGSRWAIV